jgi:hypothetical protein
MSISACAQEHLLCERILSWRHVAVDWALQYDLPTLQAGSSNVAPALFGHAVRNILIKEDQLLPALNPLDFHLWENLKSLVLTTKRHFPTAHCTVDACQTSHSSPSSNRWAMSRCELNLMEDVPCILESNPHPVFAPLYCSYGTYTGSIMWPNSCSRSRI